MAGKKFHIRKNGDPGECRAKDGECPLDRGKQQTEATTHFPTPEAAQADFEASMSGQLFSPQHDANSKEKMFVEAVYLAKSLDENPELLPDVNDADIPDSMDISEEEGYITSMEQLKDPRNCFGYCGNVAETIMYADKRFGQISQDCDGPELNQHIANTFTDSKGREWVVDYTYSQIEPNAEWPYVGTREEWTEKVKNSGFTKIDEIVAEYNQAEGDSYKMSHQPDDDGPQGHDVEDYFPNFYERPEIYRSGYPVADKQAVAVMQRIRGNPEAEVTLYRAVPEKSHNIRPGNWVTLSKEYAKVHAGQFDDDLGEGETDNGWSIVELKVKAKDIRTPGDSIQEWGYFPDS